jgi:AraC-like DNA-binding protein
MRVRELLVTTAKTLAEIAEELSYSDVSQLSREFRGVTGMAPGQWRAKTANENARTALGAGASRR